MISTNSSHKPIGPILDIKNKLIIQINVASSVNVIMAYKSILSSIDVYKADNKSFNEKDRKIKAVDNY